MDNQRPELDLKHLGDICPDKSGAFSWNADPCGREWLTHQFQVPVIVVFTKYDQFLRNVKIHLEDFGKINDDVSGVAGRQFKEHYLHRLGGVRFVRLESTFCIKFGSRVLMLLKEMHKPEMRSGCHALLKETVEVLNGDAVTLMLLAAQRSNLELSVSVAVKRWVSRGIEKGYTLTRHWSASRIGLNNDITRDLIKTCLFAFPQIWASPLFYFGSSFLNPFLILLLQFVSACITLI